MQVLNIMITAVNAVLPITLLILLGYFLKKINLITKEFIKIGNDLVFKIALPCMLFVNVYSIESFSIIHWDIIGYIMIVLMVIFILGYITAIFTTKVPERRGVIWQCCFRSNFAIIGLSLAGTIGGSEAMGVAAVISAFTIPVFNIMGVIALTVFMDDSKELFQNIKNIVINVFKNPLIIGVLLGGVCLAIRTWQVNAFGNVVFSLERDTKFLYSAISSLKSLTTPLALIVLGGQFEFSAIRGLLKDITVGTVWRIIIAPLLGVGGAVLLSTYTNILSCGPNEYPALIALFGSPVAVSSAVMADSMGSDGQLAGQLLVWSSVCSIMTIFITVCILMACGLLTI